MHPRKRPLFQDRCNVAAHSRRISGVASQPTLGVMQRAGPPIGPDGTPGRDTDQHRSGDVGYRPHRGHARLQECQRPSEVFLDDVPQFGDTSLASGEHDRSYSRACQDLLDVGEGEAAAREVECR